jgi:hypothetical protein
MGFITMDNDRQGIHRVAIDQHIQLPYRLGAYP